MRSSSSLIALTSTWRQKRSMARGGWRCSSSHCCMVMRSRSSRERSRSMARMAPRDGQLFAEVQERQPQKRFGEVSGAGSSPARRMLRRPPGSMKENSRWNAMSLVDAQAAVEIQQIDAAAQQDVLAVVDGLRIDLVGGRAAAQERARFEEFDGVPGAGERRGRSQSRQAAADDDYVRQGHSETR